MKALWIRVEAHEVDSVRIEKLAEALDVDVVTALGHYAALGGAIAEHAPDGIIAEISDLKLERWAHWSGKKGRFAAAVRAQLQTEDGEFSDWEDSMGKLVERRAADRDRKEARRREVQAERERRKAEGARKTSADKPPVVRGQSADNPEEFHGQSAEKGQNSSATERTIRTRRTVRSTESGSREADNSPASASLRSEHRTATALPAGCIRFLDRFYPVVTGDRRADSQNQLTKLAAGLPVRDGKNQDVRAYSTARLEAKCLEVIAESRLIRDPDKAIVILLAKLGDTTDVGADLLARDREGLEPDDESRAIDSWMRAHPKDVDEIRTDLAGGGPINAFAAASIDAQIRARVRQRLFAHAS